MKERSLHSATGEHHLLWYNHDHIFDFSLLLCCKMYSVAALYGLTQYIWVVYRLIIWSIWCVYGLFVKLRVILIFFLEVTSRL